MVNVLDIIGMQTCISKSPGHDPHPLLIASYHVAWPNWYCAAALLMARQTHSTRNARSGVMVVNWVQLERASCECAL